MRLGSLYDLDSLGKCLCEMMERVNSGEKVLNRNELQLIDEIFDRMS